MSRFTRSGWPARLAAALRKFNTARRTLANWPQLLPDKLGWQPIVDYKLAEGGVLRCRGRSTDVNEGVVVLSGLEYPPSVFAGPIAGREQVILDVGANIGAFVVYANRMTMGPRRIIAIEPFSRNFTLLEQNCELNAIAGVQCLRLAVAPQDGDVRLDVEQAFDAIRVASSNVLGSEVVRAVRLPTLAKEQGFTIVDVLKMDVEGMELSVLPAEVEWLALHVDRLVVEVHLPVRERQPWLESVLGHAFAVETVGLNGAIVAQNRSRR